MITKFTLAAVAVEAAAREEREVRSRKELHTEQAHWAIAFSWREGERERQTDVLMMNFSFDCTE